MCTIQENCSILVKSMKFGTSVGFVISSICGYRAKSISSQNPRWPPKYKMADTDNRDSNIYQFSQLQIHYNLKICILIHQHELLRYESIFNTSSKSKMAAKNQNGRHKS